MSWSNYLVTVIIRCFDELLSIALVRIIILLRY